MRNAWGILAVLPVVAVLSGCSDGETVGDIGTLWGEESSAERKAREEALARRQNKVPVQAVRSVEIGRTSNGILLTAFGTAPGMGYSLPALRVRRGGRPADDGYLDFDFVATEPAPGFDLPPGNTRTRAIRADLPIDLRSLPGIKGLRVWSLQGQIQVDF